VGTLQWAYERVTVGRLEASKDAKQKSEVAAATATKKKTTGSSTSSSSRRRGAESAEDELASLFADLSCRDVADEIHILDSSIKSQQASAPSWQKQIDGLPKVLAIAIRAFTVLFGSPLTVSMNAFQGWTVVFMGPSPTGKHLLLARVRPGAALSTVRIPIAHDGKHCLC
jgi:hypothetical protein